MINMRPYKPELNHRGGANGFIDVLCARSAPNILEKFLGIRSSRRRRRRGVYNAELLPKEPWAATPVIYLSNDERPLGGTPGAMRRYVLRISIAL
jgi:hypothetical protein